MAYLDVRLAHRVLAIGVLLGAGTLGVSCVGLFNLDGYAGALADLCEKLRVCYGEGYYPACAEYGEPRLMEASTDEREAWLQSFADKNCLETCASARACLDMQPICGSSSEGCGQTEQCCGFLKGQAECKGGGCCHPFGTVCTSDGDCCDGVACSTDSDTGQTVCGGQACTLPGEDCTDSAQCCTKICDPMKGVCSDQICLPQGSPCSEPIDCCSQYCETGVVDALEGAPGVCAPPPCVPDGATCPEDPTRPDLQCCSPYCVTNPITSEHLCSMGECLPDGQFCAFDDQCCSTKCDPLTGFCIQRCGVAGDLCDPGSNDQCCPNNAFCSDMGTCCSLDTAPCIDDWECCSGQCRFFECKSDTSCSDPEAFCQINEDCCTFHCDGTLQQCCALAECHSVCAEGGPLGNNTTICLGNDPMENQCIVDICNADPYCCCTKWDKACVDAMAVTSTCAQIACAVPLETSMND